jgi:hypothetical protein
MVRPRVFISHSSKDKAFVESLVEYLEKAGVKTWLDSRQLKPGDSIVAGIQDGLTDSDYIVLVLSHNSVTSRWVQAEINAAFMQEMDGQGTRIIPIKIDDCAVPILLSDRVYIDFQKSFYEGAQKLADRLLIENAEVKISIRFGRDLGLKKSIAVHCNDSYKDCARQLRDFSLGDIENLLFHKLGLSDLRRLCFRVLEQSLDEFGARAPKGDLTTEFLCAVKRDEKQDRLIEVLCQEYSERLCT